MLNVPMEQLRNPEFKDHLLSEAKARRMEIIAEAQQQSSKELEDVEGQLSQSKKDSILHRFRQKADQEISAAKQTARKELLQQREQLVDELFEEVRQQLDAFTGTPEYLNWLCAKLKTHSQAFAPQDEVRVVVRQADLVHQKALEEALPGCRVSAAPDIRIGGLRADNGHILFNETLDLKLAEEKEQFYHNSGLNL